MSVGSTKFDSFVAGKERPLYVSQYACDTIMVGVLYIPSRIMSKKKCTNTAKAGIDVAVKYHKSEKETQRGPTSAERNLYDATGRESSELSFQCLRGRRSACVSTVRGGRRAIDLGCHDRNS
jgi:hypothetical protein